MIANVHIPTPKPRRRRLRATVLLAASGLLVLAGCGGSSSSSNSSSTQTTTSAPATTPSTSSTPATGSSGGGQTLALAANSEGQLAYSTTSLSAKAGKVTIAFTNMSPIAHDVTVESASGERVGGVEPFNGSTKDVTVTLKAGTYKFYCSVPGHRQAGMEGTLTVK